MLQVRSATPPKSTGIRKKYSISWPCVQLLRKYYTAHLTYPRLGYYSTAAETRSHLCAISTLYRRAFAAANCTSSRRKIFPAADLGTASMNATFRTFLYGATCKAPHMHVLNYLILSAALQTTKDPVHTI
jgi:hypothetical protein